LHNLGVILLNVTLTAPPPSSVAPPQAALSSSSSASSSSILHGALVDANPTLSKIYQLAANYLDAGAYGMMNFYQVYPVTCLGASYCFDGCRCGYRTVRA
jgi:hypothetical protein